MQGLYISPGKKKSTMQCLYMKCETLAKFSQTLAHEYSKIKTTKKETAGKKRGASMERSKVV